MKTTLVLVTLSLFFLGCKGDRPPEKKDTATATPPTACVEFNQATSTESGWPQMCRILWCTRNASHRNGLAGMAVLYCTPGEKPPEGTPVTGMRGNTK